jgi:hypothetical protein
LQTSGAVRALERRSGPARTEGGRAILDRHRMGGALMRWLVILAAAASLAARAALAAFDPDAVMSVPTTAKLQGIPASAVKAVVRLNHVAGDGSMPVFFVPQSSSCMAHGEVADPFRCVDAADGNSWRVPGENSTFVDNKTGSISTDNATITALTQPGLSAQQIVNWLFCTTACGTSSNYDAVRGVANLTSASTIGLVNGVGGYVSVDTAMVGENPTSVALFGAGVVNANDGRVWGANATVGDCPYRTDCSARATGRQMTGAEIDLSFSSTHSVGTGLLFAGNSIVQPAGATALTVGYLDYHNEGAKARWNNFLYSLHGSTQSFAFIGALEKGGSNINSQPVTFAAFDGGGTGRVGTQQFLGSGVMNFTVPVSTASYSVSTLPVGATAGARAFVVDAKACTFNAVITGGGSVKCPVFHNGAAWVGG